MFLTFFIALFFFVLWFTQNEVPQCVTLCVGNSLWKNLGFSSRVGGHSSAGSSLKELSFGNKLATKKTNKDTGFFCPLELWGPSGPRNLWDPGGRWSRKGSWGPWGPTPFSLYRTKRKSRVEVEILKNSII